MPNCTKPGTAVGIVTVVVLPLAPLSPGRQARVYWFPRSPAPSGRLPKLPGDAIVPPSGALVRTPSSPARSMESDLHKSSGFVAPGGNAF